jgi:hypothetical protein
MSSTNYVVVMFAGSAGAAGYYLYHRNGTAGYVRTDIGGATYFILEGLLPGTLYHIRVAAYDVADQESEPTAEVAVMTFSAGENEEETPAVEELEIRPNRASLSGGETVEIIGPASLAQGSVVVYTLAGGLVREVTLREDATQTLNPVVDLGGAEGLYIIVAPGRRLARLLVTP